MPSCERQTHVTHLYRSVITETLEWSGHPPIDVILVTIQSPEVWHYLFPDSRFNTCRTAHNNESGEQIDLRSIDVRRKAAFPEWFLDAEVRIDVPNEPRHSL